MENIIEVIGLVLSVIALVCAIMFNLSTRQHNKNSVRPYPDFMFCHSDNTMFIKVRNAGTGPLILYPMTVTLDNVEKVSAMSCFKGVVTRELMKKYYELDYGRVIVEKALPPNSDFVLISLCKREDVKIESEAEYYHMIAKMAQTFKKIRIKAQYSNIYGDKFVKERDCNDFFGVRYPEYLDEQSDATDEQEVPTTH